MDLWLDDVRPAPEGWVWVKTVEEAIVLMITGQVERASLDHDLGVLNVDAWRQARDEGYAVHDVDLLDENPLAATGYDFVLWMAEHDRWPAQSIVVHSANVVGARNMTATVDRYSPYERPCIWAARWE